MTIVLFLKNVFLIFPYKYKNKSDFFFSIYKFDFFCYHKTDLIFLSPKNQFFLVLKNRFDNFFLNQKTLIYLINTNLNFALQKLFFLHIKNRSHFSKPKSIFITTQIWIFNKESDAFINKLMWFSFVHVYNISFMSCIKGYTGHKSLEDQTLSGWNGCLTPSHSIT